MTLPKIAHLKFKEKLPHNDKVIELRPFTVKEEKILLYAERGDEESILDAIKQVINNCVMTEGFDIDAMPMYAVEFLFLRLRSKSVNNKVSITITDKEDGKEYPFEINLDEVKIFRPENHDKTIKFTQDVGLIMDYPSVNTLTIINGALAKADADTTALDFLFFIMAQNIEKIFDADNVYVRGRDFTPEEAVAFLEGLPSEDFKRVQSFFETIPHLYYPVKYKNSLGNEHTVDLKGLASFF